MVPTLRIFSGGRIARFDQARNGLSHLWRHSSHLVRQASSRAYGVLGPRINIETLQQGASITDEQYIREQRIPEKSIRRGVFMRNLTSDEFLAQVHNNLGVVHSERKNFEKAAIEYGRALDLDPRLPAAWYNYGNDLLRAGECRRAARFFSKSLRLYPTDVWALNNRGLAYLKLGRRKRALQDFQEALTFEPGFEQARKNLEGMHSRR